MLLCGLGPPVKDRKPEHEGLLGCRDVARSRPSRCGTPHGPSMPFHPTGTSSLQLPHGAAERCSSQEKETRNGSGPSTSRSCWKPCCLLRTAHGPVPSHVAYPATHPGKWSQVHVTMHLAENRALLLSTVFLGWG